MTIYKRTGGGFLCIYNKKVYILKGKKKGKKNTRLFIWTYLCSEEELSHEDYSWVGFNSKSLVDKPRFSNKKAFAEKVLLGFLATSFPPFAVILGMKAYYTPKNERFVLFNNKMITLEEYKRLQAINKMLRDTTVLPDVLMEITAEYL